MRRPAPSSLGLDGALRSALHRFDARGSFLTRIGPTDRVLDAGCGRGGMCSAIIAQRPEVEVFGVDLDASPLLPDGVGFTRVDLDKDRLPFPDDYFDIILFIHVIEHLFQPLHIAPEFRRVLRDGGLLYVETPNWVSSLVPSLSFHREQHGPFNFYDDPTHVRPWSKHGLYEFVTQFCGLDAVKVGTVRNWLRVPLNVVDCSRGLISGQRAKVISAVANATGWSIYAIGKKP